MRPAAAPRVAARRSSLAAAAMTRLPLTSGDGQRSRSNPTAIARQAPGAATATTGDFDCRSCGACCASFRVSFYWAEAAVLALPDELVEQLSPWHACLAGSNSSAPRCRALQGEIGSRVRCTVYAQRPSPCRELQPGDDRCRRARQRHGLPPLVGLPPAASNR